MAKALKSRVEEQQHNAREHGCIKQREQRARGRDERGREGGRGRETGWKLSQTGAGSGATSRLTCWPGGLGWCHIEQLSTLHIESTITARNNTNNHNKQLVDRVHFSVGQYLDVPEAHGMMSLVLDDGDFGEAQEGC
ncbi:hypothetical protein GLAREA_07176 [Glarea lozoyensis ATCC 20868]|uniref:Uncharacterized protein n=1 Tax=Glarea lozoyensis (strain ATCC 20868 / MF5171) TaxID=1116229 RepID=S3E744_GLAL2|nr:uncharacterized protein GLAREA_07176 [Glarea lozoyensis ATCC 20868]EPE34163.1 hypothetical protein GLAREA_07176 [Glarea lozoyensis ATCC 20868]